MSEIIEFLNQKNHKPWFLGKRIPRKLKKQKKKELLKWCKEAINYYVKHGSITQAFRKSRKR
jgi:hypothetical protein